MLNGDGNENSQKESVRLISKKKELCSCSTLFWTFLCRFLARLQRETSEDAYILSPNSTQNSTVFRFPAIFMPCNFHDH